jgi:hypothetical protein
MTPEDLYVTFATARLDSWNRAISAHIVIPIRTWAEIDAHEQAGWKALAVALKERSR